MKKFISLYSKQIIIALLFVGVTAGTASALFPFTGNQFIRNVSNGDATFGYGYGFGSINDVFQYGYGYGYDIADRYNHYPSPDYADFGFFGDDGAVTVDNISVTQTTAMIDYSTNYLARFAYGYALSSPVNEFNAIGSDDNNTDYFSGAQQINLSNLICGTMYYLFIVAKDAGDNHWEVTTPFTTSSCSGITSSGSHGTQQQFAFGEPGKGLDGSATDLPKSPWLKYGDFGPGPKSLQKALNHLGFTVATDGGGSPGQETSFFGPKTKAALKKFQKAHGLEEDGIFGPKTKVALEAAMK